MDDSSTEQVDFEPPEEISDGTATNDVVDGDDNDREIEGMKIRVAMLEEAARKSKVAEQVEEKKRRAVAATSSMSRMSSIPSAPRSVYVGNVDFSTTAEELAHYFEACGTVDRLTIAVDKMTGHPKGYAYIEFRDASSVETALLLSGSVFKGRPLSVAAKRVNVPGHGAQGRGWGGGPPHPRGGHWPYPSPHLHGSWRGRGRGRGGSRGGPFRNQSVIFG